MQNGLAVRAGAEREPSALELAAQLGMVVDLRVRDQRHVIVGIVHRLLAAGEIDDGQPAVSEHCTAAVADPGPVGPAPRERVGHPLDGEPRLGTRRHVDDSGNPAHVMPAPGSAPRGGVRDVRPPAALRPHARVAGSTPHPPCFECRPITCAVALRSPPRPCRRRRSRRPSRARPEARAASRRSQTAAERPRTRRGAARR